MEKLHARVLARNKGDTVAVFPAADPAPIFVTANRPGSTRAIYATRAPASRESCAWDCLDRFSNTIETR